MKKIKDFINKYPKLKRLVKIFGVVAIILSFLFNALIIGSLIINANKSNDNKVLAYGDYQPKMVFYNDDNDYLIYNFADFYNKDVYQSLIWRVCDLTGHTSDYENGFVNITSNNPIQYSYTCSTDSFMCVTDLTNGNYFFFDTISFSIMRSSNPNMLFRAWFGNQNDVGTARFDIEFNAVQITYYNRVYAPYDYTAVAVTNFGKSYSTIYSRLWIDNAQVDYGVSTLLTYFDYIRDQSDSYYYDLGYDNGYDAGERVGKSEGIDEGYASGYDDGLHENDAYNLGYTDGYNTGETNGYNQGYSEGSTGLSSNPFKLIANAFDAVASILNIQVLPNLTLGVIIFTPIIVIIILVVVKFIRG